MTKRPSKTPRDVHAEITDTIIKQIEAGAGEFKMPWHQTNMQLGLPVNAVTGNAYRGINILNLWIASMIYGYSNDEWATYKQWTSRGAQVRKGEKGSLVIFYKEFNTEPKSDDPEDNGRRFVARASTAFNASQVDGYEPADKPEVITPDNGLIDRIEAADIFVGKTGANIRHGGSRAYYKSSQDFIQMPDENLFIDTDHSTRNQNYYSTQLHELTHWTGHKKRLDRTNGKKFGDHAYAFEELVAELGAAFLCAKLGIENEPRADHAQYIDNWLTVLRKDKRAIVSAASMASKAVDYLDALDAKPEATTPAVIIEPAIIPPAPEAQQYSMSL